MTTASPLSLTPSEYFARLDALFGDMPKVRALLPASNHLASLGYGDSERLAILTFANVWGSVSCCPLVREVDRDDVERLLPWAEPYEWAKHAGTWELGPACPCGGDSICANCNA